LYPDFPDDFGVGDVCQILIDPFFKCTHRQHPIVGSYSDSAALSMPKLGDLFS
jgi:hypothetical protein